MRYIVFIVRDDKDVRPTVEFSDMKIEFVALGQQFHGRHFRGIRPTHVVDCTKTAKWFDYFSRAVKDSEWVVEE